MKDLGVTPDYVEIPFGQLFASVVSGKLDMMGISATILPSRALKGLFANFPVFYESIVIVLKPGSNVSSSGQLNAAGGQDRGPPGKLAGVQQQADLPQRRLLALRAAGRRGQRGLNGPR